MTRIYRTQLLLTVLSIPLGACSSLFGVHHADRQSRTMPTSAVSPVALATPMGTKTMLGRQQLAEGEVGTAIETFQQALAFGEDRAPVINGLGVAYARIGRSDLALRYFEEAAALAPADKRYASNLALLLNSPSAQHGAPGPALATSFPKAAPEPVPVKGMLQRVSNKEFRIVTADSQPAPVRGLKVNVATQGPPIISASQAQASKAHPRPTLPSSRSTLVEVAAPSRRLQRVSPSVVHVASYERKPLPAERKAGDADRRFQPLVRIALAAVPTRRPAPVIRIVLSEVRQVRIPKS